MRNLYILTFLFLLVAPSCKKNTQSDFPNVQVEQYVYLNNPQNYTLHNPGGWVYTDGGYRGLVVIRRFVNGGQDDFAAFDRACPEHFAESCSRMEVTEDDIFVKCLCHDEEYLLFDGSPSDGATQGMKQYGTKYSAGVLYIFN